MKKMQILAFIALILVYAAGVFAGAYREIKVPKQAELYEYFENAVSDYNTGVKDGIKNAAADNAKNLVLILLGTLCKPLSPLILAALGIKGYLTGFSVMAALRLYGVKGFLLCGANLLSSAVVIPAAAYFGSTAFCGMFGHMADETERKKRTAVLTIFLVAIFCADCFARGFLTPIMMNWAAKLM